jgi:hypothetical protein
MKTFVRYYKHVLIIWVAIGIGLTGFFYIYPEHVTVKRRTRHIEYIKIDIYTKSKLSLLYTVVGSIMIGGFGFIESKRKSEA